MNRNELVSYLDSYLDPDKIKDDSINGLQVPGDEQVSKIAVATDATLDAFKASVENGCNFLFAHHGMFWSYRKEGRITPLFKKKLQFLFDNNLSVYASHLPLDMHPECGNNKVLFDLLELQNPELMGLYHGSLIGMMGTVKNQKTNFNDFVTLIETQLQDKVNAYHFSGKPVKKVAIITGGGQFGLKEAQERDFDTFITGEMNHYMYHVAKENGINVILAGHYRTETLGPKAVAQHLKQKFGLDYVFLDFPTRL